MQMAKTFLNKYSIKNGIVQKNQGSELVRSTNFWKILLEHDYSLNTIAPLSSFK